MAHKTNAAVKKYWVPVLLAAASLLFSSCVKLPNCDQGASISLPSVTVSLNPPTDPCQGSSHTTARYYKPVRNCATCPPARTSGHY